LSLYRALLLGMLYPLVSRPEAHRSVGRSMAARCVHRSWLAMHFVRVRSFLVRPVLSLRPLLVRSGLIRSELIVFRRSNVQDGDRSEFDLPSTFNAHKLQIETIA